ncbi:hypothetical protein NDU88_000677 [Pleurodeles waltl]|uniref:Uncharacterized protein n=1 Tax=Pleurodeles waltl TaxID=8319 RepID=A0AAV7SA73_PLEWA|nr:hypothetical protein NDU88_000677 [Pleurodeles waltl]
MAGGDRRGQNDRHSLYVPTTSKARRKQYTEGKGLTYGDSGKNHNAMEPELQIFPMLVYLLLHKEYQRRRLRTVLSNLRCGALLALRPTGALTIGGFGLLGPVGCSSPMTGASAPPPDDANAQKDRVTKQKGGEDEAGDGRVAAVEPVDSDEEEAEDEDVDNRTSIIQQYFPVTHSAVVCTANGLPRLNVRGGDSWVIMLWA